MSGYSPIVGGETTGLRTEVESIFTAESDAVAQRLLQLETRIGLKGYEPTFGAEVEVLFVHDPRSGNIPEGWYKDSYLYKSVVVAMAGGSFADQPTWPKGMVIDPSSNPSPIMVSHAQQMEGSLDGEYNPDQPGIVEVRTAPANALTTIERYWQTIQTIGSVAEAHSCLGIIVASDINLALMSKSNNDYVRFSTMEGARLMATTQHNLNAIEPLQLHAGLATGARIMEAYPSKHASTAVHEQRIEIKHPTIGLVDPRLDILAMLRGIEQFAHDDITAAVTRNLHACTKFTTIIRPEDSWNGLSHILASGTALWDHTLQKFVLPTAFQSGSITPDFEQQLDDVTRIASNGDRLSAVEDYGLTLRKFMGKLCVEDYHLRPRDHATISAELTELMQQITIVDEGAPNRHFRYMPNVVFDSPESHLQRRRSIARSSTIRAMLGSIVPTIKPAAEALERRQALVRDFEEV